MVKTIITPSEPLSPAKPQQSAQSALAQARAARAQLDAIREQQRAKLAARTAPINPPPQAEPEPPQPSLAERWNAKPAQHMVGPIVAVEGRTVIQSAGRGQYVVHELAADSPVPPVNDVSRTIKNGVWKSTPKEYAQDRLWEAREAAAQKEADKIIGQQPCSPEERAKLIDLIRKDQAEDREHQKEMAKLAKELGLSQGRGIC